MTDRVTLSIDRGIADVRLSRPDKMNALDPAMFDAIIAAIDRLAGTPGLRCVVLSGEGRAFCAGLDMASMATIGSGFDAAERAHPPANRFQQVAWGWRTLGAPVIAAVHGIAFGGGLQIMAGADIRIVHPDTRLSAMELKWGIVPDMAGFALWRGTVRDDVLREYVYTAREFSGREAVEHGFATRLDATPLTAAMALAAEIAGRSPQAVRAAKRLANAADDDAPTILVRETEEQVALLRTPDQMEAVRAAMERRAPDFRD